MTGWKALVAAVGIVLGLTACRDFEVTCSPVGPNELPDRSTPGEVATDRAFGSEMWVWGKERNTVREGIVELYVGGPNPLHPTEGLVVRGSPARLQNAEDTPYGQPAFIFQERLCEYSIWLDASMTDAEIFDYAARF